MRERPGAKSNSEQPESACVGLNGRREVARWPDWLDAEEGPEPIGAVLRRDVEVVEQRADSAASKPLGHAFPFAEDWSKAATQIDVWFQLRAWEGRHCHYAAYFQRAGRVDESPWV